MKFDAKGRRTAGLSRRAFLNTAGFVLAAPALIGRAKPASAQNAFAGESLAVMTWSGNYEDAFRRAVVEPFNERYGTHAVTMGGWDQMAAQIMAAPADNPPFDITIADEYTSIVGLKEKLFATTDRAKLSNLAGVQPWYIETRPQDMRDYGIPFGLGFLLPLINRDMAGKDLPLSWKSLWDPSMERKLALDGASFVWLLAVTAMVRAKPGLEELYSWKPGMADDPLFATIEELRPAKWYRDGAELSFVMSQEQAVMAEIYSIDAFGLVRDSNGSFETGIPEDGTVAYTDWYIKVRGTRHDELSDMFLNYMLEKETQDRILATTTSVSSRADVTVPQHWVGYPATNDDLYKRVNLIDVAGWTRILDNWDALDARFKEAVLKTSSN